MTINALSEFDNVNFDGLTFCSRVYTLFEKIRSEPDGVSRLRMKKTIVEKKLLEELLPICKYIQAKYDAGRYISVCWLNGNQKHDAVLTHVGMYIEQGYFPNTSYLEITCALHENEYLSREALEKYGVFYGLEGLTRLKSGEIESNSTLRRNDEFISKYAEILLNQINKKSKNTYPEETTLVVQCSLNTLYLRYEWLQMVNEVQTKLPDHKFKEIFIYASVEGYTASLCHN